MKLTFETFRDCLAAIDILDAERPAGVMLQPFVIVHGIRSFRKWTAVPLSQINIVTGPNSSGKSTLLEIIASLNRTVFRKRLEEFAESTSTPTHIGFSFDLRRAAAKDEYPYYPRGSVTSGYLSETVKQFYEGRLADAKIEGRRAVLLAETKGSDWPLDIYIFLDGVCVGFTRIDPFNYDSDEFQLIRISRTFWEALYCAEFAEEIELKLAEAPIPGKSPVIINRNLAGNDLDEVPWVMISIGADYDWSLVEGLSIQFDENMENPAVASFILICGYIAFFRPFECIEIYVGQIMPGIRPISSPDDLRFNYEAARTNDGSVHNARPLGVEGATAFRSIAADIANEQLGNKPKYSDGKKAVREINSWLSRILNSSHKLGYRASANVLLDKRHPWSSVPKWKGMHYARCEVEFFLVDRANRELGLKEVGTGVSQLLPVIASIIGGERQLYCQPELHLHPKAQSILGDLIIYGLDRNRRHNKKHGGVPVYGITLETHSEHLILRILRRVREFGKAGANSRLSNRDLAVMYLDPRSTGTELHYLRVDATGEFIDVWPSGFFIDRFEDIVFG